MQAIQYAVLVVGREARSGVEGHPIVTPEGARFWVTKTEWVEASSVRVWDGDPLPSDLLTFRSREKAEAFARRWTGHPWWCIPSGEYEIVEVTPHYEQVQRGWDRAAEALGVADHA